MRLIPRALLTASLGLAVTGSVPDARSAAQSSLDLPANVIALEGTPRVRMDAGNGSTSRRQLTQQETAANRLAIRIQQGRYFWTSQGDLPLTLSPAGEFMYLASPQPGKYIRVQRINDRLTYAEHVGVGPGGVTFLGELRLVLRK